MNLDPAGCLPGSRGRAASSERAADQLPAILIVDDDPDWAEELSATIRRYGFDAVVAESWSAMLAELARQQPAAILLDQHLGSVDTIPRLAQLRAVTGAAIIMIAASSDEVDRILGLETGADDFLAKPVSGREVVARLRARLRDARPPGVSTPRWQFSEGRRALIRPDGGAVPLTSAEFELMLALVHGQGETQSREKLTQLAFGRDWRFGDRSVDNSIAGLRRKLGIEEGDGCIRTVRGAGYVFIGFDRH
ncbi:response regulator transcription factor [Teichococcus deserti]|uniref:response regulator transcription factor n=1 Tax=Teichococcus deserti TaxID=1817963 RepID=UPI0013F695D9|nr:response regulator transcription factor [Pseudoroseomonas deserti]